MELVMLQVLDLVLIVFVFSCSLVIQGSAEHSLSPSLSAVPPAGEGIPGNVPSISIAPASVSQPNGTDLQPAPITPPVVSPPVPQPTNGLLPPSIWPGPSSPPNHFGPPPESIQDSIPSVPPIPSHSEPPPFTVQAPAPIRSPTSSSPPTEQTHPTMPGPMLPNSHQTRAPISNAPLSATPPGSNVPAPRGMQESAPPSPAPRGMQESAPPSHSALPENPPPSYSALPEEPPSLPPDVSTHPTFPGNSPPVKPILNEPPSSPPPEQNFSPMLAPPPSISKNAAPMPVAAPANATARQYAPVRHSPTKAPIASNPVGHSNSAPKKAVPMPVASPANKTAHQYAPVRHSPTEAPIASNPVGHSNSAPPPHLFSKSTPVKNHHEKGYKITPPPLPQGIPPTSGTSASSPPVVLPDNHFSPVPAPSPASPSGQAKIPSVSPKTSPLRPSPRSPKMSFLPPMQALPLPPPPPHKDCAPLTCIEPLTYGPPQSPCVCVLPIQVGLRLTVALYTFFPLVSELAAEIAAGVFLKQSQVRIMGANAAEENPEKTIVLVDLLPLGEKFDDTTAYLTFQRFWHKQVIIKTSFFGDYDVLYVRYPGLPPSPPLPPSTIGIVSSKPYPGHDNNARTIQPLGVDVNRRQHKNGLSRSILATIILSCFVAAILFCAIAWVLLFRSGNSLFQPDPTQPTTIHSLAKSSGIPTSVLGSGPSSPSFSLGSSIAAYTGSAKTFSSSDIEKATNFFSETRILGEGGFGRVYSGLLEDGTKIAVKLLKRYDQQGGREFLAEVEMLSRLHHRNLVKLIGICVEDRTRGLIYELIPNGSVESHLHGIDKERSPLDWSARLKIALGAARALAYLHEDSSPPVIHRDFKASNILLEDDFIPKVSDFGLARAALNEENKHISTRVMGTFGYVAPEYAMTGHLLVKSDVYSYGVVLLELLTGRKPVDMSQPPGQENLVTWARPLLTSREGLEAIIDQSLGPDFPFDSISKVAAIASMCVQPEVSHRPFMGEVVQALKLVCNECDRLKESTSRTFSHEDLSMVTDARTSTNLDRLPASLLTPSTVSDYDYRHDVERDLSMSELLGSSAMQDSESFRRYSTSGPLRTGRGKPLWKTMRQLSRGSISEHGVLFRLWPGSH